MKLSWAVIHGKQSLANFGLGKLFNGLGKESIFNEVGMSVKMYVIFNRDRSILNHIKHLDCSRSAFVFFDVLKAPIYFSLSCWSFKLHIGSMYKSKYILPAELWFLWVSKVPFLFDIHISGYALIDSHGIVRYAHDPLENKYDQSDSKM